MVGPVIEHVLRLQHDGSPVGGGNGLSYVMLSASWHRIVAAIGVSNSHDLGQSAHTTDSTQSAAVSPSHIRCPL